MSDVGGDVSEPISDRWQDAVPRLPAQTDARPKLMNLDDKNRGSILRFFGLPSNG